MKSGRQRFLVQLFLLTGLIAVCVLAANNPSWAQEQEKIQNYVQGLEQTKAGMTLWQTIKSGGLMMLVLCGLSIIAAAMVVYNFFTLNTQNLAPKDFSESVIEKLEAGQVKTVKGMCKDRNNIISRVVNEGLSKQKKGATLAREAMENIVKNELGRLWQNISYLADIAAIAPLVGLLGTVLGMIQAFNVIAAGSAVVKPVLLAAGVSKAMVTTAGGLAVAIPVMLFYSYFRGKVQDITNQVETYSTDIIKTIEEIGA